MYDDEDYSEDVLEINEEVLNQNHNDIQEKVSWVQNLSFHECRGITFNMSFGKKEIIMLSKSCSFALLQVHFI